MDAVFLQLAADWCINLSAGWFGAAVIIPTIPTENREEKKLRQAVLIENLLFAVAFFGIAYILKNA